MQHEVTFLTEKEKWDGFLEMGLLENHRLISNAQVEMQTLQTNSQRIPVTINRNSSTRSTWVASLANAYGPYARDEIRIINTNPLLKPLFYSASYVAEQLIQFSGLTRGSYINNWLVATNLYARDFDLNTFVSMTELMTNREPSLPVIFRSLTPALHADLIQQLIEAGFVMLPTRQVWIADNLRSGEWRRHQDIRRDLKLENKFTDSGTTEWIESKSFTPDQFEEAIKLYQDLYRIKYTQYNADYTEAYLRIGVQTGFLQLTGLLDKQTGRMLGVVGMIRLDDMVTTPILGYDLAAPIELGIYRRLTLHLLQKAEREKRTLHCSGGAGLFKRNRGANSHTEFAAIWPHHLPHWKRPSLHALNFMIKKIALPYLQHNAL